MLTATEAFNAELLEVNTTFYRNQASADGDELASDVGPDAEAEVAFLNNLIDVFDSFYEELGGEVAFESEGGNLTTDDTDAPIFTDDTDQVDVSDDGLFADAEGADFDLAEDSPAIDAGVVAEDTPEDDITGRLRDASPDAGAYESERTVSTRESLSTSVQMSLVPNPTRGTAQLQLERFTSSAIGETLAVRVCAADGREVIPRRALRMTTRGVLPLDVTALPPGVYHVYVSSEEGVSVLPLVRG